MKELGPMDKNFLSHTNCDKNKDIFIFPPRFFWTQAKIKKTITKLTELGIVTSHETVKDEKNLIVYHLKFSELGVKVWRQINGWSN